jgi:arylsulfatase A-like enzyme
MTVGRWCLLALGIGILLLVATWDRRDTGASSPTSLPGRLVWLTGLACWFGIVAGALYGAALAARQYLGGLVFHHRELLWMSPASFVLINLAVAALIAPLVLMLDRDRWRRFATGAFAFVNVVSLQLRAGEIVRWAVLILAAGAAVHLVRLGWQPGRRAWRFVAVLGVGIAAGSAITVGWRAAVERNGMARVVRRAGVPNVLLVVLDTVRAQNLSLYGYDRSTTPTLERMAASSAVFDLAIAPSSWTLPSHAALLSGQIGSASGGDWQRPATLGGANLPARFQELGYATGGFVANLLYTSYESGLTGSFLRYDDYRRTRFQLLHHSPIAQVGVPRSLLTARSPQALWQGLREFKLDAVTLPSDDVKPAPIVTDAFLDWHSQLDGRPFFALLNYFDAHQPYRAPRAYLDRFRRDNRNLDRYDAAIAFIDSELDRLFTTLERRDALDNTIVVVTSDHGELLGEYGLNGHANALYLPSIHVPLLVRYPPRVPAGERVQEPVSLIDVAATILDLAGSRPAEAAGFSLVPLFSSAANHVARTPAVAELIQGRNVDAKQPNAKTWLQSVVAEGFHYIRSGDGREEIYDLSAAPAKRGNLVSSRAHRLPLERLRRLIAAFQPPIQGIVFSKVAKQGGRR